MSATPTAIHEEDAIADLDTRQYYHNAVIQSTRSIKRKSFRRLILLFYTIDFEYRERNGQAYEDWLEEKDDFVNNSYFNFVAGLDVETVKKMRPSTKEFCVEEDVDLLYSISDETLREYIRTIQAIIE